MLADELHVDTATGGYWRPTECQARRRVAVIIPFRDRYDHLQVFLRHMIPLLRDQLLEYKIFLVEQVTYTQLSYYSYIFNRNSGIHKYFDKIIII